ncbi:hypothetical protein JXA47_08605, partial [Candidatus Sumerlaeota bacterium]|nr:hypothetical protein [Candidatus Sumerlaeota bacterium]
MPRWFAISFPLIALMGCATPPQIADGPPGSAIAESITGLTLEEREARILEEFHAGHVPDFLRDFVEVAITEEIGGETHTAVIRVAPDYFTLGTDEAPFLCPISPMLGQRIADELGCTLPTRKMVDAIWAAAEVKLEPSPIPPSPEMTTVPVFMDHNRTVRAQRAEHPDAHPLGALVAGHKKDVIITSQITPASDRVAIYGWHYLSGDPIQPVYHGHVNTWVDYSHGVRLVDREVVVDGETMDIEEVLADPVLSALLSDEGPMVG